MRVLVIEDDESLAQILKSLLYSQNYAVEVATNGEAGWDLIEMFDYDLIVLDVLLPKVDGIQLCQKIRSHGRQVPILMLTGQDDSHDKAIALDSGADDYVVKPFDPEELVARIRALLRRSQVTAQPILEWGRLKLDPASCVVTYDDKPLSLTPKEYGLIELFLRNNRRVFSCSAILDHLWAYEEAPGEEAVRTHIKGLRQKLKQAGAPADLIETVYGIGYRLKVTEPPAVAAPPETEVRSALNQIAEPTRQKTLALLVNAWNRFKGRVNEQVDILDQAAIALLQNALDPELRAAARREAHTLAGSLGTFGFPEGSRLARQLEQRLRSEESFAANEGEQWRSLVAALREVIAQEPNTARSSRPELPNPSAKVLPDREKSKVLAVDNDPKILTILQTLLEPWGLQVATLEDPRQFWPTLETTQPDLLILDVEMPHLNGIQLCQAVRSHPQWCDIPILFLTVHSDADVVNQVYTVGADDFVSKPIVGPELVTRIVNRLERIRLLQRAARPSPPPVQTAFPLAQSEAALRESEERWQLALRGNNDGIWDWNVKTNQVFFSPRWKEMLGYEDYEVANHLDEWSKRVHPDDIGWVTAAIQDHFAHKTPFYITEHRVQCKDGSYKWILDRGQALWDENGNVMRMVGSHTDITDRKTAEHKLNIRIQQQAAVAQLGRSALSGEAFVTLMEEALTLVTRSLEGEYALVLEVLPEGNALLLKAGIGWSEGLLGNVLISTADSQAGYTLQVNQPVLVEDYQQETRFHDISLLQTHGIVSGLSVPIAGIQSAYGVLGIYTRRKQAFSTDDIHFMQAIAHILSETLRNQESAASLRRAKEELELRVAERTAELIKTNHQLQLELDERRRAEEALRISQERFSGILSIAGDAIISIDDNQRITLFNQGAEKIFGYSAQEVLGQPLDTLLPARFSEFHRQHVDLFNGSTEQSRQMGERQEIYGRRRDGSEFPAEASISKLSLPEETLYTVILRDITDRKQIDRMKDEFISVVSHELRTPLTSIHGALKMLATRLLKADSEQGQRLLRIATNSTDRLVRLINDILDIERIESGRVKMAKVICNVADLVTESINLVQPIADKEHITLEVSNQSILIWADPDRIVQTLTNLLSNAIKFSSSHSTVWLSVQSQEQQVLITIQDRGRGIPTDNLNSIFERFQQVDSSDARNHDGTGLGLSICRSIVQQHHGQIWVESTLGKGSTFYLTLPFALEQKIQPLAIAETTGSSAETALTRSPLVLVCDDEPPVQDILRQLMQQRGYRVLTASSGEEAIAQAIAAQPDVILLDLLMPGMTGWETMAALKARAETRQIPIVICSVLKPDETELLRQDFTQWVHKPLDEEDLFQSLKQALTHFARRMRVLVVEDDPEFAQLLMTLFKQHDIETFHAQTGREAILLSQEVTPDLLVLDVVLPEGDGFAVAEWLRHHKQLCNTPLVIYSTRELDESEQNRLKLGYTEFLIKGRITVQEFEQRVLKILQQMVVPG
jgi:PAS domain S-box-containing protein